MHASPALRHSESDAPAGDYAAAFEVVYRDFHARIYNLVARIVGNPDDAADITQEVFLRAFAHPIDTSDGCSVEPWLYRIAVNASYDHLRRGAARPATSLDRVPEVAAPGDGFAHAETARLVESCLAGLTPRYRTALVLKDLHGMSTTEIAEVMGVHQGAARVLLHRARAAFRHAFRDSAPTSAGSASILGLATFLPDLPVPASLQVPPWAHPATPATAPPDLPPDAACTPAGGGQAALSGCAPAAAAPIAAAPLAPAGLFATLGSVAGVKVALAVLATTVVTGGGLVASHSSDAPANLDKATSLASLPGAAASPLTGPADAPWTHRGMVRERLRSAGLPSPDGEKPGRAGAPRMAGAGGNGQADQAGHGGRAAALGGSNGGDSSHAGATSGSGTGGAGGAGTTAGESGTGGGTGGGGTGSGGTGGGTGGSTGAAGGSTGTGSGGGGPAPGGSGGGTGGGG